MTAHVVEERLRALHVGDDRRAGSALEDAAREQREQAVTPDDLAGLVDDAQAIAVAVPGDADAGFLGLHPVDQRLQVLRHRGVGVMIGEAAVHLAEEGGGVQPELLHRGDTERSGRAVARVDHES